MAILQQENCTISKHAYRPLTYRLKFTHYLSTAKLSLSPLDALHSPPSGTLYSKVHKMLFIWFFCLFVYSMYCVPHCWNLMFQTATMWTSFVFKKFLQGTNMHYRKQKQNVRVCHSGVFRISRYDWKYFFVNWIVLGSRADCVCAFFQNDK